MSQKSVLKKLLEEEDSWKGESDFFEKDPQALYLDFLMKTGVLAMNLSTGNIDEVCYEAERISRQVLNALLLLADMKTILKIYDHCQSFLDRPNKKEVLFNLSNLCYLMFFEKPDPKAKPVNEDLVRKLLNTWLKFLYNLEMELGDINL